MKIGEIVFNLKKLVLLLVQDFSSAFQKRSPKRLSFWIRVLPLAFVSLFFLECFLFPLNAQAFRLGDRGTMQRQLERVSQSPLVQRALYPFLLDFAGVEVDPQSEDEVTALLHIFRGALLSCLSDLEREGRFSEREPASNDRTHRDQVFLTKRDRASFLLSSRLLPDLIRAVVPQNPRLAEAVVYQIFENQFLGFFTVRLSVAQVFHCVYNDHAEFGRILDLWRE